MSRRARQKSNSGIYHVMLRGINRSTIFHDDEDCEKFLQVLGDCLRSGSSGGSGGFGDSSLVPPCGCDKLTVPYAELPVDITAEQLDAFIRSEQPNIHPFPERISDREAEQILRSVTGLDSAASFIRLPKAEQIRFLYILLENDLSIQQMARLTGIAKSNIARYLA